MRGTMYNKGRGGGGGGGRGKCIQASLLSLLRGIQVYGGSATVGQLPPFSPESTEGGGQHTVALARVGQVPAVLS